MGSDNLLLVDICWKFINNYLTQPYNFALVSCLKTLIEINFFDSVHCRFCCRGWPQNKTEKKCEKKDKYIDLAREMKKLWKMLVIIIPIVIGAFGTVTKGTGELGSWRTSGDHPNYNMTENCLNTAKSPGDLRRLAVTQTPVKNYQLMLVWKTISARRPDLIIINKKERTCKIVDFAVPADHRIKLKECKKKDKYFDLATEMKKTVEHEGDDYTDCGWCFWYSN